MREVKLLRGIVCIMGFLGLGMLFGCEKKPEPASTVTYEGSLYSFSYRPGYSDMNGAYHSEGLKMNKDGSWIIESDDREEIGEPTVVTTYAVDAAAVFEFEAFLKEKKVLTLENRKDSDDFMTDYSSWSISFSFVHEENGEKKYEDHRIDQYKKYYDADYKIIGEIIDKFNALRGEVLSQREERD